MLKILIFLIIEARNVLLENLNRDTGQSRARRAIAWCTQEITSYGIIFSTSDVVKKLLLKNLESTKNQVQESDDNKFPNFIRNIIGSPNIDNLQNFLLSEQVWLSENSDLLTDYVLTLARSDTSGNTSFSSQGIVEVFNSILEGLHLNQNQSLSVFDPAFGSGSLLFSLSKIFPKTKLQLAGQEINPNFEELITLTGKILGLKVDLRNGDSLRSDEFENSKFDLVLIDTPIGLAWDSSRVSASDTRFTHGLPSNRDAGLLFLQAGLSKLKSPTMGGGIVVATTTSNNLLGEQENAPILESFVEHDLIQAVIALPRGIKEEFNVATYVLVLNNLKSHQWRNKIQFVDLRSEFEDLRPNSFRQRIVTKSGLTQIVQAMSKPKPLKIARILDKKELWLYKKDIMYPEISVDIWNKKPSSKAAKFTQKNLISMPSDQEIHIGDYVEGLSTVEERFASRYLSLQVEPRFHPVSRKTFTLNNKIGKTVSLLRLAEEIIVVAKSEVDRLNFAEFEYLAIPRNSPQECRHIQPNEIPNEPHKYIFVRLKNTERYTYLTAWLNSSFGVSMREEIWRQIQDEERFMSGLLKPSEILQFLAYIQVPFLKNNEIKLISEPISEVEQSLRILNNLKNEVWTNQNAISTVRELSKIINGEMSLSRWTNDLPFPLAASLRTYQSFALNPNKGAEQLIHFWEATSTFLATYLLSALRKSEQLWLTEIPNLQKALSDGKCSFDRATLGTWRITIEYLSKFFRLKLNSEDLDEQDQALGLLGGISQSLYEKIFNVEILSLLVKMNYFRNRFDGHSGTLTKAQEQAKHDELLSLTNDLKAILGNTWNEIQLIRPIAQYNLVNGIELECEILMGPTTPFVNKRIQVQENLIMNELYLVSQNGSVHLLPFIKMGPQRDDIEDTCYFYNRQESGGARFVSYHKTLQNEVVEKSDLLMGTLNEINSMNYTRPTS